MSKRFTKEQFAQILFIAFMFIYFIILSTDFFNLSPAASLFPKIIIVSLTVLGILRLISVIYPKVGYFIEPPSLVAALKEEMVKKVTFKTKTKEKTDISNPITLWSWVISLVISFYVFGILISLSVGIFIFLFFIEKKSLITSLTISTGVTVFSYYLFNVVLRTFLFEGVLFIQ